MSSMYLSRGNGTRQCERTKRKIIKYFSKKARFLGWWQYQYQYIGQYRHIFGPTNAVIKHLGERSVTEVGCFIVQQYILTLKLHQSTKTPNFNFNLILYFFLIIKHLLRIIDSRKRDGGGNNCKSYSYYLWCKIRRRRIMVELIHLTPTTIFANVNHIFPPIHLTMTQLCWILTSCQLRFYVICMVSESFLITFSVINNLDI